MQIIPVIDLYNGLVVHARFGDRQHYQPLQSFLYDTQNLVDYVKILTDYAQTDIVYIADLDSITRAGDNVKLITSAIHALPHITFWVDSGYPYSEDSFSRYSNFIPVLGAESLNEKSVDAIKSLKRNFILSLDFNLQGEMGPKMLYQTPQYWPNDLIVMNLTKVGSGNGPDFDRLACYIQRYSNYNFIAAGGVRHDQDLVALQQLGVKQVLVATAIHDGSLTAKAIAELKTKKYPG